jgi:glutaconate CoA-transferase, subunit A
MSSPRDKRMTLDEVVGELHDGMTIGIGGWGPRRKPMALVRAILRSDLTDLTIVSYGGADVGLLCEAGKVRRLVYGFVSLDSVPLEPLFQRARQEGTIAEVVELDEGMVQTGLRAAAQRLPFLPMRAGLGSDVLTHSPHIRTVTSPYAGPDGVAEQLVAVPALELDAALVHLNRADVHGNATYLGPDPYFDDLFCMAARQAYVSVEQLVDTAGLTLDAPVQRLLLSRMLVSGVVEAPNGAHFTTCTPDYERDERFMRHYAGSAADPEAWPAFRDRFLSGDERHYQDQVTAWHLEQGQQQGQQQGKGHATREQR